MLKKLTAMLTAVAMVLGMLVIPTYAENSQYTDMTIDSFYGTGNAWYHPQIHDNGNWRFYLKPSVDMKDVLGTYHLKLSNGTEEIDANFYAEAGSSDQLYTTAIPASFIDATKTQEITIKKGTYQAERSNYGINLTKDFVIYINNGSWSGDKTKVTPASGNAKFSLNLTPNDTITTGGSVNGFYLTADIDDGAQKTNDNWAKEYDLVAMTTPNDGSAFHLGSGIFAGDTKRNYRLIKYTDKGYYVETSGGASVGTEYTVKGLFQDKNGKLLGFDPITVTWNGTAWSEKKAEAPKPEATTFEGSLTIEGAGNWATANTTNNTIHMHGSDAYLSAETEGQDWDSSSRHLKPADEESGIYWGTKRLGTIDFRKIVGGKVDWGGTSVYYFTSSELQAAKGDILTIKGTFVTGDEKAKITFAESKLQWTGSTWRTYQEAQQYTGALSLDGIEWFETQNVKPTTIYLRSTDTHLANQGEAWNTEDRLFKAADTESGIWIDNKRWTGAVFQKFLGGVANSNLPNVNNMWAVTQVYAKAGQVMTIKGNFISKDENTKIHFTESKFTWTGTKWVTYEEPVLPDETGKKLTLDTETNNGGNANGIYLTTNDGFPVDETWAKRVTGGNEATSGIFLNGKKIEAPIFRYTKGRAYLGLADAAITAKDKDKVTIKGTFVLDGYRVAYQEATFYYNGQVWATTYKEPAKVVYSEITLDSILEATGYRDAEERWDIYLSTKGKLPGVGDKISFNGIKVEIDGTTHEIGAYHAAHEDSFFFILEKNLLPKDMSKNTKIVIKAGKYEASDVTKGIHIKKDYTIYANKYGLSTKGYMSPAIPSKKNIKLAIDREIIYGGDGNGIFVTTEDKFPVDESWQTSIRAITYDDNSGIFFNGKKINAVLKRFQDGKMYIGLIDGGFVAQDGDKVTIKGTFVVDDYAMSYAEHTFYYNGKTWNTTYFKQKTKKVKISGVSINEVSSYDAERKWWNVYVNVKGKLPGTIDQTNFDGLEILVNGKPLESKITYHSYQDTLYFPIPEANLPQNAKNGTEIVIKAGKAGSSDRLSEILWTKDFKFYTFAGSLTEVKPTNNTKWLNVSDISLFKTSPYHEEWNAWQVLIAVKETFTTEGGTYFYQLPIEINGKEYLVKATQSGTNLAFDVTKDMVDPKSNSAVLKVKAGAKALANAGKDGVHIKDSLTIYLFNQTWSDKKYTKVENTDCKITGVQDSTYVQNPDGSAYTNMYIWMDTKMPGSAWFEAYLVPVLYNGKETTVQMERVVSLFGRLMYFGLSGTPKEGDTVQFKAGTKAVAGGLSFTIKNDYTMYYSNGQWSEYVKSNVKKPKAENSLWDVARFDSSFIPYTKSGVVTFSNTDKYNMISSTEPMKDYTIKFKARKLEDNDEAAPNFSVMLRANAVDENTPLTSDALYGYVITFQYNQLSLFKNRVNWGVTDAYRVAYEPLEVDEKFFEFGEDYEYEISIYNVTDTCACITISVNGVEQIRYYDHATKDPKDPVLNAGDFRIYAECTTSIIAPVSQTNELLVSKDACETNEGVYVAASYPFVLEDTEFTVDKAGAFVEEGVFKATEPGTYTISGKYKGKDVGTKTIVVTQQEKKQQAEEEEVYYEEVINWPVVIAMAAGGVIVLIVLVILIIKMKKRKTGKAEVE